MNDSVDAAETEQESPYPPLEVQPVPGKDFPGAAAPEVHVRVEPALICTAVASVISCRRHKPEPILEWYAEALLRDGLRVPRAVYDVRAHGIRRLCDAGDFEFAQSLAGTFDAWWRTVHPALVIEDTPETLAVTAALCAEPDVARLIGRDADEDSILTAANARIVATAVVRRCGIVTAGPAGFAALLRHVDVPVTILPVTRGR